MPFNIYGQLFAQNDESLCKLVDAVHRFSDAIQISLGISKCATLLAFMQLPRVGFLINHYLWLRMPL